MLVIAECRDGIDAISTVRNLNNKGFTHSRMIVPLFMYLDHRSAESSGRGLKPTVINNEVYLYAEG